MIDAVMVKRAHIQCVVCCECICIYYTVRFNLFLNDRHQSFNLGIGNHRSINFAPAFQQSKNSDFTGCTTAPLALTDSAKIAFICFYFA